MISLTAAIQPLVEQLRLSLKNGNSIQNIHERAYPPKIPHEATVFIRASVAPPSEPHLKFLLEKYSTGSNWPITLALDSFERPWLRTSRHAQDYNFYLIAKRDSASDPEIAKSQLEQMEEEVFKLRTGYWITCAGAILTIDPEALNRSFPDPADALTA